MNQFFNFVCRKHLADAFNLTVDRQCGCHHHAELHDVIDLRNLFDFRVEAKRFDRLFGMLCELFALRAARSQNLYLHGLLLLFMAMVFRRIAFFMFQLERGVADEKLILQQMTQFS